MQYRPEYSHHHPPSGPGLLVSVLKHMPTHINAMYSYEGNQVPDWFPILNEVKRTSTKNKAGVWEQ